MAKRRATKRTRAKKAKPKPKPKRARKKAKARRPAPPPPAAPPAPAEVLAVPASTREDVRAAILKLERAGKALSVTAVRTEAKRSRPAVATVLAAYQAGALDPVQPWGEGLERAAAEGPADAGPTLADLQRAIREAKSPGDLADVLATVTELAVAGKVSQSMTRALVDGTRERRRAMADEDRKPKEKPGHVFLAFYEVSIRVADLCDRLCSDERQQRLLAFAEELMAEDLEKLPNADPCGSI